MNCRFNLNHLNVGDRIEVLMKKGTDLPDRVGLFKKFHVIEEESVRMEFLVLTQDPEFEDPHEEVVWYVSLNFVDQVRKLHFH